MARSRRRRWCGRSSWATPATSTATTSMVLRRDYPRQPRALRVSLRAALEWASSLRERYDSVHAHDWQAGIVAVPCSGHFMATHSARPTVSRFTPGLTRASLTRAGLRASASAGELMRSTP